MISLPGPDGKNVELKVSLSLIAGIEREHGSLYLMAEQLLSQSLPLSTMVSVLKAAYRHCGCDVTDEFVLLQPCSALMVSLLLGILGPMEKIGAARPGEAVAGDAA